MKYKNLKFLILTILLIFTAIILDNPQTLEAASDVSSSHFRVKISCGFDGYAKYGGYIPISIQVTNSGPDFTGSLRMIVDSQDSTNQRVAYTKNIEIHQNESVAVEFSVAVSSISSPVFDVTILDSQENKCFDQRIRKSIQYTDDIYIGILSDDFNSLRYIDGMPFFVSTYSGYVSTRIFELSRENFSSDPLILNSFDAIIINDFNTSSLSESQYEALKQWLNDGGTLLIGTGSHYDKTLSLFQDGYLTCDVGQLTTSVTDFDLNGYSAVVRSQPLEYEEESQEVINEYSSTTEEIPTSEKTDDAQNTSVTSVSTSTDEDNIFITQELTNVEAVNIETIELACQDGTSYPQLLCQSLSKGDGKIFILSFDMASEIFKNWEYNMQAIQNIFVSLTEVSRQGSLRSSFLNYYYVQDMLSNYIDGKLPNMSPLIVITVLYIILVVPVAYFILKKRDKRHWLWFVVPALACIFTILIFAAGRSDHEKEPYINYSTILTSNNSNSIEKTYFSVTSPQNKSFDFSISGDYKVSALSSSYYGSYDDSDESIVRDDYDINLTFNNENTVVDIENINVFGSKYFYAQRNSVDLGEVETNITYTVDHYEGTITNNTGYTLENAFLKLDNGFLYIGSLSDGESYHVDNQNIIQISSFYEIPEILNNISAQRRRMLTGYIYGLYSSYYTSSTITPCNYFGAFVSDYPVSLVSSSNYSSSGNTLIWNNILINCVKDGTYTTPNIFYNSQLLSGDMDSVDHYFYSDTIKFECYIPSEINSADSLNLISPGSEDMNYYLYNWEKDTYDEIFKNGSDQLTGKQLEPYIRDRSLRIQIEKMTKETYSSAVLPVFSLSGRER